MSEKRKPEETICPFLAAARIIALELNPGRAGINLKVGETEITVCLGNGCQMYSPITRACGLRFR